MAAYRDDHAAIADRTAHVRAELARIDDDLAKHTSLVTRRVALIAELDDLVARRRRSLPRLGSLTIETPCTRSWDAMEGTDRKRWCGHCHEPVYDLAAFTDEEAEALLAQPKAPCVRFARRVDGTVTTSSCKPPAQSRTELAIAVGVIGAVALSAAGGVGLMALPALGRSRVNQTRSDAQAVRSAVLLYLGQEPGADCPTMEQLVKAGTIDSSRRTTDAWDRTFRVECDGDDILVRSDGPDGAPGTEDDIL